MISQKLRSRLGMTLAETLTALAVFAILSVALVVGTTAAWKVYQKAVVASEARTLQSTLIQSLADELRYARNIRQQDGGTVVFDSEVFGMGVSVTASDGKIQIGTYDLLPEKTYTKGLKASAEVAYENGVFTVTLTITHELLPGAGRQTTFHVRALNGEAGLASAERVLMNSKRPGSSRQ